MRVETPHNRSGLSKDVVLRLLTCDNKPDAKDRVKYEKTKHFLRLRERVEEVYGTCVLCEGGKNLVTHHRNYRNLFREHVFKDVGLLCQRCHGRYHRGHRGRG